MAMGAALSGSRDGSWRRGRAMSHGVWPLPWCWRCLKPSPLRPPPPPHARTPTPLASHPRRSWTPPCSRPRPASATRSVEISANAVPTGRRRRRRRRPARSGAFPGNTGAAAGACRAASTRYCVRVRACACVSADCTMWCVHSQWLYMVSSCEAGDPLQEECTRQVVPARYDYKLDIPVLVRRPDAWFQNIYCAACHGRVRDLWPLQLSFACTKPTSVDAVLSAGLYRPGALEWRWGDDVCVMGVRLGGGGNDSIPWERPCTATISRCPPGRDTNTTVVQLCAAYSAYVQLAEGNSQLVYKNPECAMCHGVERTALTWYASPRDHAHVSPRTLSLQLVMDFGWHVASHTCPGDSVWDGLRGLCLPLVQAQVQVQQGLTVGCLAVSATCLVLHILVYWMVPRLHNVPGKNLQALSWALLVAQAAFLLGANPVVPVHHRFCQAIAALLLCSHLAAFLWMNAISVDLWCAFAAADAAAAARPGNHRRYAVYAWGVPALVTALALAADSTTLVPPSLRPAFATNGTCWFGTRLGLAAFLVAPATAALVANLVLFVATACTLHQHQRAGRYLRAVAREEGAPHGRGLPHLCLYTKLLTVMGVSWLSGTVAVLSHQPVLWYPYVVLNGLQGAFIFFLFDVRGQLVRALCTRIRSGHVHHTCGGAHVTLPTSRSSTTSTSV